MIDLAGPVTYRDGRVENVHARQSEMAAWERYALRKGYPSPRLDDAGGVAIGGAPLTMIRYLGFAASHAGQPESEWPAFDQWDASVEDVTLEAVDDAGAGGDGAVPPTLREASGA